MPVSRSSVSSTPKLPTLRLAALPLVAALAIGPTACNAGASANSLFAPNSSSAGSPPASAPGTKQVQIMDPSLNMVAYTLTIPSSWNFQGAILTNPGCGDSNVVAYRVWSDDLRYGVQRMPSVNWFSPEDPTTPIGAGCKKMQPLTPVEYAGMVVPTLRPGATLVGTSPAPEAANLADFAKQMDQVVNPNGARLGIPPTRFGSAATRLRITYNMGSLAEEEFLDVMEDIRDVPNSTIISRPGQILKTAYKNVKTTNAWIVAERAPKGQLDASEPKLDAVRKSLTINPEWDKKMADLIRQRGAAAIKQSWVSFNANYKANQDAYNARFAQGQQFIANMQAQGEKRNAEFAAYEDSRTRHTADEVDYILDRQYYVNPSSGQTSTISTTYTNNWQNGAGDAVLTNIQGYDPNGLVQGNWTQLQPIKH
jgi:hypothetical protein